ncbi:hypothetical protein [Halorubellus sp. PRR65]|uniref:hypothetical protein n=1 Tax=Halorubellus sp. PRR65 TaxID=3098148 RepID=UPI002B25EC79|nr:hypothetical protein [Halorubellus sp. PRR65]
MTTSSDPNARPGRSTPGTDDADPDARGGSLGRLARASAGVATVAGVGGALYMLGAFGPVTCATSTSSTGEGTTTTTHACTAGIDYVFGAGGNAPVLFFWSVALLALVGIGAASAWTNRIAVTWTTAVLCGVVTVIGVFSIGWFFLVPTVALLTAAVARTVAARRRPAERTTDA